MLALRLDGGKVIFAESDTFFGEKAVHSFILSYYRYKIIELIYEVRSISISDEFLVGSYMSQEEATFLQKINKHDIKQIEVMN